MTQHSTSEVLSLEDKEYLYLTDSIDDIMEYFRSIEHKRASKDKFKSNCSLSNRRITVNWIYQVAQELDITPPGLYLGINVFDRYIASLSAPADKAAVQLYGVISLNIGVKIHEREDKGIPLSDYQFLSANTYSIKQMIQCEMEILQALDFDLSPPSEYDFIRRWAQVLELDTRRWMSVRYICDLFLLTNDHLDFSPSLISVSVVYRVLCLAGQKNLWTEELVSLTGYNVIDMNPCLAKIFHTLKSEAALWRQNKDETNCPVSAHYSTKDKFEVSNTILVYYARHYLPKHNLLV